MTINKTAAFAHITLRTASPKARTRTLDADDIAQGIRDHLKHARRLAKTDPTRTVTTTLRGGYVPNGYRYAAESDDVRITGTRAADVVVVATRARAQSRAHGIGPELVTRSRGEGESMGRIEYKR